MTMSRKQICSRVQMRHVILTAGNTANIMARNMRKRRKDMWKDITDRAAGNMERISGKNRRERYREIRNIRKISRTASRPVIRDTGMGNMGMEINITGSKDTTQFAASPSFEKNLPQTVPVHLTESIFQTRFVVQE